MQGFVGWFGPYDLDAYVRETKNDTSVRALLHCGADACAPAALADASPIRFVDGKDPPVLLIHGSEDIQVSPAQSQAFAERLRTAGVPVELLLIAGRRTRVHRHDAGDDARRVATGSVGDLRFFRPAVRDGKPATAHRSLNP